MRLILGRDHIERLEVLFECVIPLFRSNLSLVGEISVFIDHLRLNDVEYLLRIYVSAFMTLPFVTVNEVDALLKINNGVNRISVVDLISAGIKYEEFIK